MPTPQPKVDWSTAQPIQPQVDWSTATPIRAAGPRIAGLNGPLPGQPSAPEPPGIRGSNENGLRRYVDDLTRLEPANTRSGVGGHIITGAGNIGAGFMSPLTMIAHPLDTATGMARMGADAFSHSIDVSPDSPAFQLEKQITTDPAGTAEAGLGQAALGMIGGEVAGPAARIIAPRLERAGAYASNVGLGTSPDEFGGDPGMAAARNEITGFTPRTILARTNKVIPRIAAEHEDVLAGDAASPLARAIRGSNPTIDIGEPVSGSFDEIRATKTHPITGTATPTQISKLNKVQTLLTHEPDPFTGQPTMNLRPLNQYTPLEANRLKSSMYGMTDYENPFRSSLANDALKQSAHRVLGKIREAVPESADSGQNLHNMMALKDQLLSRAGEGGLPTSKSGLMSNLVRKAGTTAGTRLYHLGKGVERAGKIIHGS